MKTTFLFLAFIFIYVSGIKAQPVKLADDLVYYKIADDVYLVVHSFPWPANSLVLIGEDELLFIDTPYNDEASEKIVNCFINDSAKQKIKVINTHFHNDNLGGNNYFINIGADVYGSDMTVDLLKSRGLGIGMLEMLKSSGADMYYDYFKNVKLTPPNRLFKLENGLTLDCCNDKIEIYFPGAGHSPDNVVVYLKNRKILFGGCIIKGLSSKGIGNIGDADTKAWPGSIQNIIKKYPDAEIIIPGHGDPGDKRLLQHTLELLKQ